MGLFGRAGGPVGKHGTHRVALVTRVREAMAVACARGAEDGGRGAAVELACIVHVDIALGHTGQWVRTCGHRGAERHAVREDSVQRTLRQALVALLAVADEARRGHVERLRRCWVQLVPWLVMVRAHMRHRLRTGGRHRVVEQPLQVTATVDLQAWA